MLTADKLLAEWPLPDHAAPAPRTTPAGPSPYPSLAPASPDASHLGDLAQVLSHRIRNLLAGIEGFTDLLTDTLGTQEQRELAFRILEGTARIEYVLADLQRYTQPVDMMRMPVCLEDIVDHVLSTLDDEALRRMTIEVRGQDRDLTADPLLLGQGLLLLIQNALEAPPQDGPVALRAAFDDAEGMVQFDVWNAGAIAFEHAEEKVFEPFFTTKACNLGIGLTIARRIAEAHQGTLFLASNSETEGTCFTLKLPTAVGEHPPSTIAP